MNHRPVLRHARSCLLLLATVLLGACGFHLRGALTLPPGLEDIQVLARDPYSALSRALERSLGQAGVTVLPDQFGRAQEYSLRYAVVFVLRSADGDVLVPQQAVELARDYIATSDDATGIDSERELLTREMLREMNASILRRIDAAVRGMPN